MGISLGDAILHLKADRTQLESDLQGASGGIAGWLGGAQGMIATGIATAMAGAVMKGVTAAGQAQTAFVRLEAVYRATGGAVGMTVVQLQQLATEMMLLTGIDDEQFIAAEALAMTYGNISAEVMPRLMAIGADMAAVLQTDVAGSVRSIALACSAGEEGLMRLRRAGVIFTDEQKEMIKTLWAAGDTLGAQNIVLAELEGRFGGTAAAALDTYEGRLRSMKTAVGELWESLGNLNIGGRTLIDWMTDGATTATGLLTISGQINTAFESTRDEIDRNATSYDEYIQQVLAVAVAAGELNQSQADLFLRFGENANLIASPFARGAYERMITLLHELGIETDGAAWSGRDASGGWDEGARSARNLSDAADQLSRSVTPLAPELRPLSQEYFDNRVAADAVATATERVNAAWEYANALPGTITRRMFIQIQTMLTQADWVRQENEGIVPVDVSRNMGAFAGPGSEASGAGVWSAAEANEASRQRYLAWIAAGSPGSAPGGQRGLDFDVEGPSGTDQVPVNLALTRGEHVEVTPEGEGRQVSIQIGPNYINNRDDLQALENQMMQIFRGV